MHLRARFKALDLSQVHDVTRPGVDGIQAGAGPILVVEGAKCIVRQGRFELQAKAIGVVSDGLEQFDMVTFEQEFAHFLPHHKSLPCAFDQVVGPGQGHASY